MAFFLAVPILSLLTIIQSAIISRLPLLQGTADLILLVLIAWALQERVRSAWHWSVIGGLLIGFVSIIPIGIPLAIYLCITGIVLMVKQRIWETSILAMFAMTFVGSLFSQIVTGLTVSIGGTPLPIFDTLKLIILPSLILNLILAAPIYAIIKDLAEWVYPGKMNT
jgi:rod shape-determining protein MreD